MIELTQGLSALNPMKEYAGGMHRFRLCRFRGLLALGPFLAFLVGLAFAGAPFASGALSHFAGEGAFRPFGRGFSRHRGLPIRWGAFVEPPAWRGATLRWSSS